MIVLKDKGGRNTKFFNNDKADEAQKIVDGGGWTIDTDKGGLLKNKGAKKTAKK